MLLISPDPAGHDNDADDEPQRQKPQEPEEAEVTKEPEEADIDKPIKASDFRSLAGTLESLCSDGYDVLRNIKHVLANPAFDGNRFPSVPTPTGGVERLSDVSPLHPEDVRKFLDDGLIKLAFLAHASRSRAALVVDDDEDIGLLRPRRLR